MRLVDLIREKLRILVDCLQGEPGLSRSSTYR